MHVSDAATKQGDAFDLKFREVELIASGVEPSRSQKTLSELEAMRTSRSKIPASKHGLEAICGASCDTAAQ